MSQPQMHIGVRNPIPGVVYPSHLELERYVAEGALGIETLVDGFRAICALHADAIALTGPEGSVSYAQLDADSDRLGAALLRSGLRPLDRVVFQLGNSPQLVTSLLACLKAGLIPICTLAAHREREIGYLAELAQARLHLVQGDDPKFDDIAFAQKMQAAVPSLAVIVQARGAPRSGAAHLVELIDSIGIDEARALLDTIDIDPYQVAVFQLSGGTTGVPKIIPRFHSEYLYNMRSVARWMGYRQGDVLFMPLPMVHNLNMGCCFGPFLMTGGTITVAPNLLPETLLGLIKQHRPNWMVLGGPVAAKLEGAVAAGLLDFSSVRGVITSNGAAKMRARLGVPVYQIFGMTEGVIMLTREGDPIEALDRTVGRPISPLDQIKILAPGTELPVKPGEVGEPVFKGPYTLHGYYRAEDRNKEAFTSDGFYRSGDLMQEVRVDGVSYYVFKGRMKDVISRGGEKINCEELEDAIATHPSVRAVAVVGAPDPVFDERVCAFIIPHEGTQTPNVPELGVFLQAYGLAKFKWPERVEVVQAFPLTATGKLSKILLRESLTTTASSERTVAPLSRREAP